MADFVKTQKQIEVCDVLNNHVYSMVYGGSRSGKTTIIVRNIFIRAMKKPSRHLITRFRFNHAKTSIIYDSFPKVHKLCFPEVPYVLNKTDWFIEVEAGFGGSSQIWIGGIDDKERVEKILGNEYSTIFANECSQISYNAICILRSRLAENSGLALRFYMDMNPPGKKHWSYQEAIDLKIPGTPTTHTLDIGVIKLNPDDNKENLPAEYFVTLDNLPERHKNRFKKGDFQDDIEGALWNGLLFEAAKAKQVGELKLNIVALDPAVTDPQTSETDEAGIIVAALDEFEDVLIRRDFSDKLSPSDWAQAAVNAYRVYNANCIVAESNQGGEMIRDMIKAIDSSIQVNLVRASTGKFARAEPVAELYKQGRIAHEEEFPELELECTQYIPGVGKKSPNRLDALVWAVTWLLLNPKAREIRVAA